MQTALEQTTEYLKTRKQFGVPLSTFQALTFRAADMYVELELARSVVTWATLVLLDGGDALEAASRAKLQVSKAGRHIGKEAIQLHGGIGMTAEYSVGHFTSRLTAIDHTLGDGRHHLAQLVDDARRSRRHRAPAVGRGHEGPLAHPTELTDPCCLPALGELGDVSPREGLPPSYGAAMASSTARSHRCGDARAVEFRRPRRGCPDSCCVVCDR